MSAESVQSLLGIDKSTVYRMAQDGRLPAIKVGRQWRFASEAIQNLLGGMGVPVGALPRDAAEQCALGHPSAVELDRTHRGRRGVATDPGHHDVVEQVGHHHHVGVRKVSVGQAERARRPGPT